jgi:hypothetical protein
MPSWTNQVRPILQLGCAPCHFDGGVGTLGQHGYDYDTLAGVRHAPLTTMLSQINNCCMPPLDAGALRDQDRETLLAWLVCGRPDN